MTIDSVTTVWTDIGWVLVSVFALWLMVRWLTILYYFLTRVRLEPPRRLRHGARLTAGTMAFPFPRLVPRRGPWVHPIAAAAIVCSLIALGVYEVAVGEYAAGVVLLVSPGLWAGLRHHHRQLRMRPEPHERM